MALLYEQGLGVGQDRAAAIRWYRLAADGGSVAAQSRLGAIYLAGLGTPQDWTEAVRWLRPAAEGGDASAQFNLGLVYIRGEGGVRADVVEAYKWSVLATTRAPAARRATYAQTRDQFLAELRPAEINEGQRRARDWEAAFAARNASQGR